MKMKKISRASTTNNSSGLARLPKDLAETARIQEDRRIEHRAEIDRREFDRAAVDAKAKLCTSLKNGVEGRLFNLSAQGCSIQLCSGSFKVGDAVWFRIESIQPWKGVVRWVNEDKVGVEFDLPFYPSVFELIAQFNKPVTFSKVA